MISADVLAAVKPVVEVFEQLGIPYLIGGSIASSVYGVARSTVVQNLPKYGQATPSICFLLRSELLGCPSLTLCPQA